MPNRKKVDSPGTSPDGLEIRNRIRDWLEDPEPRGELLSLAAGRSLQEFEDEAFSFDWSALNAAVEFMERLELPDYGKRVKLENYQLWILSQIYARQDSATGLPATKLLIIEAARGAAKTFLGALICTYEIWKAGEAIQIDMGSTDKGTAGRDVANLCRHFARQIGQPLKPLASNQFAAVKNLETDAAIEVLKPDPETYHGRRPRLVFLDEAAHYLKPVITRARTGAAKRADGQVITFSTPHHDRGVPYYGIRDQVVGELVEGVSKPHEVALCWCIDDDDPIEFSEELVAKANPGLGVTIRIDEIRANFDSMVANGTASSRSDFCRQHYARFNDDVARLVGMDELRACSGACEFVEGAPLFVGLDLSRGAVHDSNRTDVCTVTFLQTDPLGVIQTKQRHFLPEHRLEEFGTQSRLPLVEWVDAGWVQTCPGRTIDPGMIEEEIRAAVDRFRVVEIGYDTWTFYRDLLSRWTGLERWPLVARARAEHTVPATEGFVDKVRAGRFRYEGDPVLEIAIKNTRVKNFQGGRRPDKDPSRSMIDPFMSLIYGLSALFDHDGDRPSAYESSEIAC